MTREQGKEKSALVQSGAVVLSSVASFCLGAIATRLAQKRERANEKGRADACHSLKQKGFSLDQALFQGKVEIGSLPLCKVLLVDDAQYAGWLVLVPQRNNLTEIIDLSEEDQQELWKEVAAALRVIQKVFKPDKLNQAAIGNLVSQLHIHITGRRRGDPSWPGVHLGARQAEPYKPAQLEEAMRKVEAAFEEEEEVTLKIHVRRRAAEVAEGKLTLKWNIEDALLKWHSLE